MAKRGHALKIAKKSGKNWNNYRNLKSLTNGKLQAAEAEYYKELIESSECPKEMWSSLNSLIG